MAAIVSADVVGYSRLMGVDEVGTLEALRAHRTELIDPLIAYYGGRIVKTMGAGLLLEFANVVAAVLCWVTPLGGDFGRKSRPDYSDEPAILCKVNGAPVRVQWTREDRNQNGYYHATSALIMTLAELHYVSGSASQLVKAQKSTELSQEESCVSP